MLHYMIQYLDGLRWAYYSSPVTTKAEVNKLWFEFIHHRSKNIWGCKAARIVAVQQSRTSKDWLIREVVEYTDIKR